MFNSTFYTPRRCEAGVPVRFNLLNPRSEKITDVLRTEFRDNTAFLTVRNAANFRVGSKIEVKSNGSINPIYLGKYVVESVDVAQNKISYKVYNLSSGLFLQLVDGIGSIYSVANIESSDSYIVNFTVQSSVPIYNPADTAKKIDVAIAPETYSIIGSNSFYPETTIKIKSRYTDASKVLVKVTVSAGVGARVLYTDYIEIICAQSATKPCEIIAKEEKIPEYIYMNSVNNWTYTNQEFHITRFIPDKSDLGSIVKLERKNNNVLPNRQVTKFRINVDPPRLNMYNANIGIEDVRRAFYSGGVEEDEITTNPYIFTIADPNKTSIQAVKSTVVGYAYNTNPPTPVTLESVLVPDEKLAIVPVLDTFEIPDIAFLRYRNNNEIKYVGELIFLKSVYYKDNITVTYLGQNLCGQIIPAQEGIVELSPCVV